MLPGTFMYVYLGYAGRAGLTAVAGEARSRSPWEWSLLVVGLAATVAVTLYVTHLARKAIKENSAMSNLSRSPVTPPASAAASRFRVLPTVIMALAAQTLVGLTLYAYDNRSRIVGLFGPPLRQDEGNLCRCPRWSEL